MVSLFVLLLVWLRGLWVDQFFSMTQIFFFLFFFPIFFKSKILGITILLGVFLLSGVIQNADVLKTKKEKKKNERR